MTTYIIVKYIHFISIFAMISMLVVELMLVKPKMPRSELKHLSKIDGLYGLAAVLVVGAGLTLWFGVGKPTEFYDNSILYIKVGIAIVVGLISIFPTIFFIKKRKGDEHEIVEVPRRIKSLIILQLILIATIPPLATMMAFGIKLP